VPGWSDDRDDPSGARPQGSACPALSVRRRYLRGVPASPECTTAKNGQTITLHYHEEKVQEVRAYNETEEFDQRYRKRPKVERKLSELLRLCGLRVGRYFGQRKTELQALWAATVANLKRAGTDLIERPRPATASPGQIAPATG